MLGFMLCCCCLEIVDNFTSAFVMFETSVIKQCGMYFCCPLHLHTILADSVHKILVVHNTKTRLKGDYR